MPISPAPNPTCPEPQPVCRHSGPSAPVPAPDAAEILAAVPLAIFVKDSQNRIAFMNRACESLWGVSFDRLRGTDCRGFFPAQEVAHYHATDAEVFERQRPVEFEVAVWNAEAAQHRIVRSMKAPMYDADGQPRCLVGTSMDITDRARSEMEYRTILRTTLDAFWVNDMAGRFVDVNDAYCEMVGYRREELLSMSLSQLEAVETPEETRRHIEKLVECGFDRFESRHRRRDGGEIDIEVTVTYLPTGGGRLIVFARDITARKKAERTIRESEARLRAHIENSPMGVVAWDESFRVTQWSHQAERIFGWTAQETLGKRLTDLELLYPADLPIVRATMAKLSDGASRYVVNENRNVTKDGRVIHCVWYNSNLLGTDGAMRSILSQVLDVTESKRAEQELRTAKLEAEGANDAKSRFLAAVSHDLRQPLSALSLYVGALDSKLKPADAKLLANMKNCVAGLNEMLSDLLDLSELDAGAVVPKVSDFHLDAVLAKVVSAHEPDAKAKRLQLRRSYPRLVGRTDPVLFQRIVGNLISNAVRYTDHGGILIGCRRRDGKTWVEVWDTGAGIPGDQTAEIFCEFKQLGNSERNRIKGTGLGLAIVAKTALLLGLAIRVQSKPGRGSMFAVELPLGTSVAPRVQRRRHQQALRIAVVEDDDQVAAALIYALMQSGHQVVSAESGARLLRLLDGTAPQVMISDYRLGGGETGLDAIAAVRSRFGPGLPALVVTGDTDPSLFRRVEGEGIRVLHKPLRIEVLQDAIADAVADAAAPAD
ncbi:MAG TPA: PAS domain S-box protein [Rhodocyclaceae bacterium]